MNTDSVQKAEVKQYYDIRTINVGSVMGTPVSMRFEMIIYSEHIEPSEGLVQDQTNIQIKLNRTPECRLIMDPMTAKSVAQWLIGQINAYEKQYGQIPTVEEQQQKEASTQTEHKKTTGGIG